MTTSFQSLTADFEPVGRAEADAVAAAAPPVAPAASAPTPAPAPTVTARIVGGPPRSRVVPLTWPVETSDGRVITEVTVRRLSTAEVRSFVEAITEGESKPLLPMFEGPDGRPIPAAALDVMDRDDWDALDRVSVDFLPAALRGDPT